MAGFDNDVMFANNVDFRGVEPVVGQVTTNGQLLIGSTASPNIRVGTLTQGAGISITNGAGAITIATDGSTVGNTITGNTGGALNPVAGNWNILGTSTNGIQSAGSGNTLTVRMQSPYADGDFNFQSTVSGATRTLTVENTSNTASSAATQLIKVAGTTAANPYTQWVVGTTRAWGLGIENSASQRWTLSTDAAGTVTPGGGNYIFSATPGATSFLSTFTFWVPAVAIGGLSNPGATVDLNIANTSATAGSDARMNIQVNNGGGAGGGNAYVAYTGPANNWSHGVDKTDSNKWKLQQAIATAFPGGTNSIVCTPAGEITFPNTPAFSAAQTSAQNNVTGDGTAYTVIFNVEKYDQNADYDAATGIFTAPVTGRYHFSSNVVVNNFVAQTSAQIYLVTTQDSFLGTLLNPVPIAVAGIVTFQVSAYANMTAGDTARIQVTASGSTKTNSIQGNGANTNFGGALIA